ncbi:glycoside hydrolase [Lutimaribacter sp. EGI FJ00015]|uniref:Glycoside hydrolase n=1 Tax=Lutimaribacter degradans TaxID=2945989 RepID=A0ACC5ZYW8_9RHOB|nr:GH25 family lysozyme [Lutimaribacter sp. EGI FJ00013]MCM2562941.1 glycoside hydrolase [Lutimaribacter sp. EGI FJ00013]MCO0614109.1 glycoside hydrolase [Lutimaribacter sp. EGI FJ00015]MCO0636086.1 glycoside hydrolase [Lutimaribacter sp. EGI FJ00014]
MTLRRRPFLTGLGATGLLAACGSRPAPVARPIPRASNPRATVMGDDNPVDWPGRTPRAYAVHGIDAARFQGVIDWRQVQAANIRFAFLKATEGGDRLDPMFGENLRRAQRVGVPVGAYHFYYFCTDPDTQARWFIRNVPRARIDLPPVLDLEWNPYSPSCTTRPDPAEVRRVATRFIARLTDHYGQRPIIYTTPDFWQTNQVARLGGEFWLRSVADHPSAVYPGARWTFWQYTGTGRVPGIDTPVDINAFAGDAQAWQNWLSRRRIH